MAITKRAILKNNSVASLSAQKKLKIEVLEKT
jgi:hypothetical protein